MECINCVDAELTQSMCSKSVTDTEDDNTPRPAAAGHSPQGERNKVRVRACPDRPHKTTPAVGGTNACPDHTIFGFIFEPQDD